MSAEAEVGDTKPQYLSKKERRRLRALGLAKEEANIRYPGGGHKLRSLRIGFVSGAMWYRAYESGARDEAEVAHG